MPNGLYLKSPKLLVFSSTPIHRASPKESVTSAEPITRRNRVDSVGVPAWCLVVIGVTVPSVPHIVTLVSLLWPGYEHSMRGENWKNGAPDVGDSKSEVFGRKKRGSWFIEGLE